LKGDGDGEIRLEGARTRLRKFRPSDINGDYLGWLNDPQVTQFSNQRFVHHDESSAASYLESFEGTANLFLSVDTAEDGRAIGTMTAYRSVHHGTADVGIMIGDRAVWGRGYGQDAWNLLIEWLLTQPGMRKVTAGTLACNQGMIRLAARSGMQVEAVRREQELVDGRPIDILYFARFALD
jgi:ribosomal-protein-alanine N-acetyltransferase